MVQSMLHLDAWKHKVLFSCVKKCTRIDATHKESMHDIQQNGNTYTHTGTYNGVWYGCPGPHFMSRCVCACARDMGELNVVQECNHHAHGVPGWAWVNCAAHAHVSMHELRMVGGLAMTYLGWCGQQVRDCS